MKTNGSPKGHKELRNKQRISALERENDILRLIVKHCLVQNGRQITMRVGDFQQVEDEPNVLIVEDEQNDRMIVKFDGEEDLVIT